MIMNTVAIIIDGNLHKGEILLPLSHVSDTSSVDVIRLPFHAPIIDTPIDKIMNIFRKLFGKPVKHRYDVIYPVMYNMRVVGRTDGEFVSISFVDAVDLGIDYDGDVITYAYEE